MQRLSTARMACVILHAAEVWRGKTCIARLALTFAAAVHACQLSRPRARPELHVRGCASGAPSPACSEGAMLGGALHAAERRAGLVLGTADCRF